MIVKEELDGIDIENLEDLLRTVFMKNVGTLKYSLTVESLLEILTKRRSQPFYKLIDVHSMVNVLGESISTIRTWNTVNQ